MGGFALQTQVEAGQEYYLRVHTATDDAGEYTLNFAFGGDKVDSISLSSTSLTLRMEDSARLLPEIAPASAHSGVIFTTSDESVCTVTQSGLVIPHGAGTATVYATAYGGAQANVRWLCPPFPWKAYR